MKQHTLWTIIIAGILGLVFLFPWFEILLGFLVLILMWSYNHYWKSKAYYGPYLYYGKEVPTKMIINWIGVESKYQGTASDTTVEISTKRDFNQPTQFQCTQADHVKTKQEIYRSYYHFQVEGLQPNQSYYYQISYQGKKLFMGKKYHFTTGPASSESLLNQTLNPSPDPNKNRTKKMIIYGDDQTADFVPILAQITNHAQYKEHPDIMVHLGDINQNLWDLNQNNAFFTTKRKLFRNIPYMPVIGNHDGKPISQWEAFYLKPHWYAFDWGREIKVIALSGFDSLVPATTGQYEFLEQALQETLQNQQFAIVCCHEGPVNIETNIPAERATQELQTHIIPLLKQYNRGLHQNILWFNGHVHSYERIEQDDLTFLTVGACSNAKYYSKLSNNEHHHYDTSIITREYGRQSFAVIRLIATNKLEVEIKDWRNHQVDRLEFRI